MDSAPCHGVKVNIQARKRNPNPNFFGPDILRWGAQKREGVGAKKFGMSLETKVNKLFRGKRVEKNTKEMGKASKICPNRKWEKMAEKSRKKMEIHFFGIFRPFFPIFDQGKFATFFPCFFLIFVVRPVFHCVAGPHDCNSRLASAKGPKSLKHNRVSGCPWQLSTRLALDVGRGMATCNSGRKP